MVNLSDAKLSVAYKSQQEKYFRTPTIFNIVLARFNLSLERHRSTVFHVCIIRCESSRNLRSHEAAPWCRFIFIQAVLSSTYNRKLTSHSQQNAFIYLVLGQALVSQSWTSYFLIWFVQARACVPRVHANYPRTILLRNYRVSSNCKKKSNIGNRYSKNAWRIN